MKEMNYNIDKRAKTTTKCKAKKKDWTNENLCRTIPFVQYWIAYTRQSNTKTVLLSYFVRNYLVFCCFFGNFFRTVLRSRLFTVSTMYTHSLFNTYRYKLTHRVFEYVWERNRAKIKAVCDCNLAFSITSLVTSKWICRLIAVDILAFSRRCGGSESIPDIFHGTRFVEEKRRRHGREIEREREYFYRR